MKSIATLSLRRMSSHLSNSRCNKYLKKRASWSSLNLSTCFHQRMLMRFTWLWMHRMCSTNSVTTRASSRFSLSPGFFRESYRQCQALTLTHKTSSMPWTSWPRSSHSSSSRRTVSSRTRKRRLLRESRPTLLISATTVWWSWEVVTAPLTKFLSLADRSAERACCASGRLNSFVPSLLFCKREVPMSWGKLWVTPCARKSSRQCSTWCETTSSALSRTSKAFSFSIWSVKTSTKRTSKAWRTSLELN